MMKRVAQRFMVTATAIGVMGATTMAAADQHGKKSIVDTAVSAGQFSTLVAAVKAAGLVETLSGPGPYTVFAPTDKAFAKLPDGTVEALLEDKAKLTNILLFHVVPGSVMAKDVTSLDSAQTVFGQALPISTADGVKVAGATVTKTDIACTNGVIHVIDRVMMPKNIVEVAKEAGAFNTLLAAAKAAGLAETLANNGPFTVFAPTDDAFAALPEGTVETLLKPENADKLRSILTYHVVPSRLAASDLAGHEWLKTVEGSRVGIHVEKSASGEVESVKVDSATVATPDVIALNGVIHVIDKVIMPSE